MDIDREDEFEQELKIYWIEAMIALIQKEISQSEFAPWSEILNTLKKLKDVAYTDLDTCPTCDGEGIVGVFHGDLRFNDGFEDANCEICEGKGTLTSTKFKGVLREMSDLAKAQNNTLIYHYVRDNQAWAFDD